MHRGKFDNLQERLMKRFMEWDDGLLAQSAKEILIKSVAQAIPTYIMGVFKLPLTLCDDLTKLIRSTGGVLRMVKEELIGPVGLK
jgi:hypothetical protein